MGTNYYFRRDDDRTRYSAGKQYALARRLRPRGQFTVSIEASIPMAPATGRIDIVDVRDLAEMMKIAYREDGHSDLQIGRWDVVALDVARWSRGMPISFASEDEFENWKDDDSWDDDASTFGIATRWDYLRDRDAVGSIAQERRSRRHDDRRARRCRVARAGRSEVSTHIQCPSCGQPAAHIVSPECTMEEAIDFSPDDECVKYPDCDRFVLDKSDGRETFECPCGNAIWIADRGTPNHGRWFISCVPPAA